MADTTDAFNSALEAVISGKIEARDAAKSLYDLLTLDEKLGLLDSDHTADEIFGELRKSRYNVTPYRAGVVDRIGLPGIRFSDGPRGCSLGESTAFPAPITRAASWDVEIEEEIGRAIAKEIRAQGGNFFAGVCVNLARHPAWGRAQEAYGEDPLILGSFGAALSRGASENLMTCVKHFLMNSMEDMRFEVNVICDEKVMHECYLPHFKQVLDEGRAASIMSCYNTVNGIQGGDHPQLNGIIRDTWGREDVFVMSDFLWGLRDGPASVKAGLDIEMMVRSVRMRSLPRALKDGTITEQDIERLGVRLIAAQLQCHSRLRLEDGGSRAHAPSMEVVTCQAHIDLARRAAQEGMVLLKNDDKILPLRLDERKRIAVIGSIAAARQTGDKGSSAVYTPEIITPLDGLKALAAEHGIEIVYDDGTNVSRALKVAESCDTALIVVGMTGKEEGESMFNTNPAINKICFPGIYGSWLVTRLMQLAGSFLSVGGDRDNLQLRPVDLTLVKDLAPRVGSKSTLVVSAGSTVVLPDEVVKATSAIVYTGYGGCRFGEALANVIFGIDNAEPAGKLPYVIPANEIEDLPVWSRWAKKIVYDRWWGYRLINRDGKKPAFPFGWGIGYGSWEIVKGSVQMGGEADRRFFDVKLEVQNTGEKPTSAIVQIYGGKAAENRGKEEYSNALLGFRKVKLAVGSTTDVTIHCRWNPLAHWNGDAKVWTVDRAKYFIRASKYEGDERSEVVECQLRNPVQWTYLE